MEVLLGKETQDSEVVTKDAHAAFGRLRPRGDLRRAGVPVAYDGEDIKVNCGLHRSRLLIGEESLEESSGVGHVGRSPNGYAGWRGLLLHNAFGCCGLAHFSIPPYANNLRPSRTDPWCSASAYCQDNAAKGG